ncbi:hypothetical protein BU26DRAFT_572194 [Trematosphaeria pertusa]|uniref:Uncharacterized protein n=1 Tax=Trematosphaeria pertusa TaxID=390896 RepID=A0A6A6HS67_9PLEO|nr:uncharacterized protein BU26DRAFT_572194 [Trematosphaeria pertusa]KAF2240956.1 hypothetical protein BU26DRAFT_572194 [Trematosphaeria pertusa]
MSFRYSNNEPSWVVNNARGSTAQAVAKNQKSRLLQLPGELLNRIYEYALTDTSPCGLQYVTHLSIYGERKRTFTSANGIELNRLKYVCGKLYAETAGLELKFNTVTFRFREPANSFSVFLEASSPSVAAMLTTVILSSSDPNDILPEPFRALLPVMWFCKQNPRVTVKYIWEIWRLGGYYDSNQAAVYITPLAIERFMDIGAFLSDCLRGKSLNIPNQYLYYLLVDQLGAWSDPMHIRRLDFQKSSVPNFRFFPNVSSIGTEFKRAATHYTTIRNYKIGTDKAWVEYAKSWVKDGI